MRTTINLIQVGVILIAWAGNIQSQTSCLVTHYTHSQYAAGSQNWSMDMDKEGFVYVGNNNGLIKYDGIHWNVYSLPAHSIVRSVMVANDGRIYTGSNEEFGYWIKNSLAKLQYISLIPLLKGYDLHNQEIWKIIQFHHKIYFQGFSSLFVYDQNSVRSIPTPGAIIFLLKAGDRMFAHSVHGELYELINDKLVNICSNKMLFGTEIKSILPYKNGTLLIGTSSKGVFVFNHGELKPWDVPANPILKENQINNGILFQDKIVFGTIVKGLFVLDKEGNILNHLYSENNLQNNTVLSLYSDNNHSIWVGLDNGIDNVSFDEPIDIYPGGNEALGSVYTAALSGNRLYVGTNRGIFTYDRDGDKFIFKGFLPQSQGQVWQLKVIDGEVFCGHNNGTYIISPLGLKKISDVSGGFMLQKVSLHGQEYLLQSTYTSLVFYKRSDNSWVYSHEVKGFIEPARFLEVDHLGNIWIGHAVKGLYRLRLSESLDTIIDKQSFTSSDGLPSGSITRVCKIGNRVVFSNGEKLFTWDDLNHHIIPFNALNEQLQGFCAATSIIQVDDYTYWFCNQSEAGMFTISENKATLVYRLILSQFNISMVDGYENIIALTEHLHLICLDNGFAIFKHTIAQGTKTNNPTLLISGFSCWNAQGDIRTVEKSGELISLVNSYNNISISFSTLKNPCSRKIYQYQLEGIDHDWSKWSESSEARYTRLPVGIYTFRVRTLSANGSDTETVSIKIRIKPAWYASLVASILYIVIILIGIFASQYFYRRRLAKHHENLHRIAEEKRNVEKETAEKEIMHLQNEKLQSEISHKNLQLADSTLSIIRKNEVLIEIKTELEKQKEELGPRYPARYLQRLTTLIDRNISNDNDWTIFESLFDQAHENFFKRLKLSFPDLTQSDLKLCAYLKLNLSSKEIAPLLNIGIRGVEIRRYRLRKRLALPPEANLVEFIMKF